MKYDIVEGEFEKYNSSAKKVVFEKPLPRTEEHGKIKKGFLVRQMAGVGNRNALFVDGELYIESLYRRAVFWRLAELSENFEISVDEIQ